MIWYMQNASAWHWWLAVGTGDYKDGLVYTDLDSSLIDGSYTGSKLMWSLGNYSRFIRPGAKRIGVLAYNRKGETIEEGDTDSEGIMISSYKNTDGSLVAVVINYSNYDQDINVKIKDRPDIKWQSYITSDKSGYNLKKVEMVRSNNVKVLARSVLTLKEVVE